MIEGRGREEEETYRRGKVGDAMVCTCLQQHMVAQVLRTVYSALAEENGSNSLCSH